jgi:hypothetical protein
MSLWGNKDAKTASGTLAINAGGTVTGTSTSFTTETKVGDYIRVAGEDYIIKSIASNTSAVVTAGVNGATLTAVSPAAAYTLSEKPKYVSYSESYNYPTGTQGDSTKVYGVDAGEAEVTKATHAGWVRRTVGTGGRENRVFYETLVANGSITGDQSDDSQFVDLAITIGTQPSNTSVVGPATATFTVVATNNGNRDLTYQWQKAESTANTSFADINGATSASYTTGATSSTPGAGHTNGDKYRVVITTDNGLATVTSSAVTLTVS